MDPPDVMPVSTGKRPHWGVSIKWPRKPVTAVPG